MMETDTVLYQPFYTYDTLVEVEESADTVVSPIDSVFQSYANYQPAVRKSLFAGHHLQPKHNGAIGRPAAPGIEWMFGVVLLAIAGVCFYVRIHRINMLDWVKSLYDYRVMTRMSRELNLSRRSAMLPILIIIALCFAFVANHFAGSMIVETLHVPNYIAFAYLYLALLVALWLRNGIIRLLGSSFDESDAAELYISNNYFFYLFESVILLPLTLFHYFAIGIGNTALYMLVGMVAFVFLWRIVRGVKLILTVSKLSSLQLFYYLCILELVPLCVLAKLLI